MAALHGGAGAAFGLPGALRPPVAATPAASAASSPTDTNAISLGDIVDALGTLDELGGRVNEALQTGERITAYGPLIARQEESMNTAVADVSRAGLRQATSERLMDLDTQILGRQGQLDDQIARLKDDARALETLLNDLRRERALWIFRAEAARSRDASADFLARVDDAPKALDALAGQVRPLRDETISLLERAVRLRSHSHDLRNELRARRGRIDTRLREAEEAPLWELIGGSRRDILEFFNEVKTEWKSIFAYFGAQGPKLALLLVLLFGGSIGALRVARQALQNTTLTSSVDATRALRVLERSGWAALLLGLLGTVLLAPRGPIAFYDLLWLFVPVPAAVLTLAALGPAWRTTVFAVAGGLLLLPFRSLLELLPVIDRLVVLVQCLAVVAAIGCDLRRGHEAGTPTRLRPSRHHAVLLVIVLLLVAAAYAVVVGEVGFARTMRNGVLVTLGLAMVTLAAYQTLLGLGLVALGSRWFAWSRAVQRRRDVLEHAWRTVLRWGAWAMMLAAPVFAFGVASRAPGLVREVMDARLTVGEAGISVGSLVAAAACLVGTWLLVQVIRLLLEDEFLPRFNLGQGLPFAISALTRYAVATLGLVFAFAAAGIDLSKMALLVGAVGVGIGFGLQNIINNFVSGLVLLVERPMHVGDLVETPTATGFVQRIGFRASTIRTTDGADIVVPNGDLLSKELLNWTLSSRERRINVDVGVAYGTEADKVIAMLTEVATGHPAVLVNPPPFTLFTGFGENTLNFRLRAWVGDATEASNIESDVRGRMVTRLTEAGVVMPIPQREVLMRGDARAGAPSLPAP
ncbi:MAG: mechanosensitive ion channel domain-containing protein [Rhizobacter sp.]